MSDPVPADDPLMTMFWLGPEGDPKACGAADRRAREFLARRRQAKDAAAASLAGATDASGCAYAVTSLSSTAEQAYHRLLPHQDAVNRRGKLTWKYRGGPAGGGLVSLATQDALPIGMIGGMAVEVRHGERLFRAIQAMDTVVAAEAQGKGCFVKLGRHLQDEAAAQGIAAIFGFPNRNAAAGWFRRLGWRKLGAAPFLFKPLRAGYFGRRVFGRFPDLPLAFPRRGQSDIRDIPKFDERAGEIWRRFAAQSGQCGVERSHAYLNWRLVDCPTARYDRRGLYQGQDLRSFVATHVADKHGGRIGYIMEALGDDSLRELLDDSLLRLKEQGADAVLAWCPPGSGNRAAYFRQGFLPLPRRLAPEIHFGGKALSPEAEPLFASSRWYLSYLDSDTV